MESEKRIIPQTNYEVIHAVRIGDREIIVGEDAHQKDGNFYFLGDYRDNGIIGEYSNCVLCDDFLEVMEDFTARINQQIETVRGEITKNGYPTQLFTAKDCYPNDLSQSIAGKVVAVKADCLRGEYRRGDVQLLYVDGGFGAGANARGSAVYGYHLNSGEHTRFERREIQGEVKELPQWAQERLDVIKTDIEAKSKQAALKTALITEKYRIGGSYEVIAITDITKSNKLFALGYCKGAPQEYGTWESRKDSPKDFYWGHYFSDEKAAREDYNNRAESERAYIAEHGQGKDARKRDEAR